MKKAIIIGKGPSARPIKKKEGYDIIALNNTVHLCEEVDFLFINDFEIIDLISEQDWKKVKCLVLPIKPHYNKAPDPNRNYFDFLKLLPVLVPEVRLHKLFPYQQIEGFDVPHYPIRWSVGTTAFQWMAAAGYSHVDYCGIDCEGGYKDEFAILDEKGNPKNHACHANVKHWYAINYEYIKQIAQQGNIQINKLGDTDDTRLHT